MAEKQANNLQKNLCTLYNTLFIVTCWLKGYQNSNFMSNCLIERGHKNICTYSEDYSPVSEPSFSIMGKKSIWNGNFFILLLRQYVIVLGKKFQSNGKITQPKGGNC